MMCTAKPHRLLDLRSWVSWAGTRGAGRAAAVDFA